MMDGFKAAWENLGVGSNLAQISILAVLAFSSPFVLTYAYTSSRSKVEERHDGMGSPPPEAPYWIPFLGNALSFSSDTAGYIQGLK
jgi:hypothetical protein